MQLCTMGQIWPGPTLNWLAHGLAFTVWLGSGAEGPALPWFWLSPMGQPAELEPRWSNRAGEKSHFLACSHRPSVGLGRFWHAGGEARRGGLLGKKAARCPGFGVKRGKRLTG
jgi:hypothetical protein